MHASRNPSTLIRCYPFLARDTTYNTMLIYRVLNVSTEAAINCISFFLRFTILLSDLGAASNRFLMLEQVAGLVHPSVYMPEFAERTA